MTEVRQRDPVSRTLQVLTWILQEAGPFFGVREVGVALGISPSAAHRAICALVANGLITKDESGYLVSVELYRLAHIAVDRFPLERLALPHLRQLACASGETVLLGVYDSVGHRMMFTAAVESPSPLRYVVNLNSWMPIHLGASGLAILAFLPDRTRRALIAEAFDTAAAGAAIDASLSAIRRAGYALTRGQRIAGAIGIAAPVIRSDGQLVGDVCLTIPEQRFEPRREAELATMVMACANAINAELTAKPR